METNAQKALAHLQRAGVLRKIAAETKDSDPKTAHDLVEIATVMETKAAGLTPTNIHQNSN
jgi:hypothetical protein